MLLNTLRNRSFWIVDQLKGSPISKQYEDINNVFENSSGIDLLKKNKIHQLLKHAVTTTQFYKKFEGFKSIGDFPVIKKTVIQNNFEQFRSTEYKNKNNFKVSTSGSTGVPFFLFQNKEKRNRNHADAIYFYDKSGFKIGNKLYELEVWRDHNLKNSFTSWMQNITQFDISKLTDQRIEFLINKLRKDKEKNKVLLGFASAFEMIAQYLEKNNIFLENLNISSVIANSEYLNPYTKKTLSKHLGVPVLSRYSSEEIGLIAQQTFDSPESFKVNHASYYLEILEMDSNNHVEPGEFGRIVVTDIFNYAMPIIRYDTGDIARYKLNSCGLMEFDQIEGRKMDLIYDTKGNIISSFVVYTKFYKYYSLLKQYQFIQQSSNYYEVKLNIHNSTFDYETELIQAIKDDFGQDAIIKISYVDEIPSLSSGKRRKVVNNMI